MRNPNTSRIRRSPSPVSDEVGIARISGIFYGPNESRKARIRLWPPSEVTMPHKAPASSSVRVAIKEQVQFPTHQGMVSAQKDRILRIKQSANSPDQCGNLNYRNQYLKQPAFPKTPSQPILPSQPAGIKCRINGKHVRLRAVGEIAADEDGNFYEVQGPRTRPLGELVMDEQGRVFEIHSGNEIQYTGTTKENSKRRSGPKQSGERPDRPAKSDGTGTSNQQTNADAAAPVLPKVKQPQSKVRVQKTQAVQQRAREAPSKAQVNRSRTAQSQEEKSQPCPWPTTAPTAATPQDLDGKSVSSTEQGPAPRCQIPQKYMESLQFKFSREEALYDMKSRLGTLPPESGALVRWLFIYPLRRLKAFTASISSRRPMKKWRAMLKDKGPDDQLWSVTPPRGFSYLPAVRYWAEERLAWAGYEPEHMLLEWEIFWRRKGIS